MPLDNPPYYADTHRCHGCMNLEIMGSTIPSKEHGVRPILKRDRKNTPKIPEDVINQMI